MGLSTGATIMISQYYGARDMENVRATVNTIYTAMMIGIIPLTIIGILCSRPLLLLMNVPKRWYIGARRNLYDCDFCRYDRHPWI